MPSALFSLFVCITEVMAQHHKESRLIYCVHLFALATFIRASILMCYVNTQTVSFLPHTTEAKNGDCKAIAKLQSLKVAVDALHISLLCLQ